MPKRKKSLKNWKYWPVIAGIFFFLLAGFLILFFILCFPEKDDLAAANNSTNLNAVNPSQTADAPTYSPDAFQAYDAYAPLAPPQNQNVPGELKIGFITDPHVEGTIKGDHLNLNSEYVRQLNFFIEQMNNDFAPSYIVINGDVIEGTHTEAYQGIQELAEVRKLFNRTQIEKLWVIGNHDLRSITKTQWQETLGINYLRSSFSAGDYDIITLDSNFSLEDEDIRPGTYLTRGQVSQEEIAWLENELEKNDRPKIVFIHHVPIWNIPGQSYKGMLTNGPELQRIFEKNNVLAVFSGHIENIYAGKRNKVNYFVIPGMSRHPNYPGAFAEITVKGDDIKVILYYMNDEGVFISKEI